MPFVLDASILACWAFRDEDNAAADRALDLIQRDEAVAPSLLWFEVRNILVVNERRKRVAETETRAFLRRLAVLPIRVDQAPNEEGVLRLARDHKLTVYDAAYLELAQRNRLPLATLDGALAAAARKEGVALIG